MDGCAFRATAPTLHSNRISEWCPAKHAMWHVRAVHYDSHVEWPHVIADEGCSQCVSNRRVRAISQHADDRCLQLVTVIPM